MAVQQISALVQAALASFKHEARAEGSTRGSPWSEARVLSQLAELKESLVTPYRQRFVVKDNQRQMIKHPPEEANYWVVAETNDYLEFYDPRANEFGLADRGTDGALPSTIGVRGDLIGVFCAR